MSDTPTNEFLPTAQVDIDMVVDVTKEYVTLEWESPVHWVELTPDQARQLAKDLVLRADFIDEEYGDDTSEQ